MNPSYAFIVEIEQSIVTATETLRAALASEKMGIVSEVDVQATLKNKLGLDSHPQRLLGICSPGIAHALMAAEPDIGALLPCGASVAEAVAGRTRIAVQDPLVIAVQSQNAQVREACERASEALHRVVERLKTAVAA
ncbi:MAG: hypothetical protein A2W72_17670 [Burkholderiales bacterium RIFCSPLOWO2_12_67_14]|nr:MAG: hypothetical protein A3I64_13160 [Burkholderiales bacterium RIFCSPLOWO2_02_FULL_67_64]OGB49223.1 MAG: hypothetical protein A2W72_17670 [Burkholderiales bacterium RIFCSPLOWO2_12_67_14]OGB50609.1 MAG: hypothetical protein A3E51_11910 [Burkholderiales bacterium RIFCSPHIGHO2_12_FULL_67_38]OGC01463.1 MAG: hypothetical protein A3G82_07810 [Burkholderiales bacterium RIFCSPLOWO2_12_FULL_67_210]